MKINLLGVKRYAVLVLLLIGGCLLSGIKIGKQTNTTANPFSEPLRRGTIIESVYGIGTIATNRSFQFKPGIISTVDDLFVKEGDSVKLGQKLFVLNHGTAFSAPFDGTITSLPVKVGENVFTQTVVLELVDMLDRYVKVSLEQRAAIRVRRGQSARLSFENLREVSFDGTVESVYSSGNDFLVRIEVKDLPSQILPGMTADAAIAINQKTDALLLPVAAIKNGTVLVKRGNKPSFSVPIKTGLVDGAWAEVLSDDPKQGDRVLLPAKSKT